MATTADWAKSLGIPAEATLPAVEGYTKRCPRTARQIAVRTLILQGVVCAGLDINASSIVEWLREQRIWRSVTPDEKALLLNPNRSVKECKRHGRHTEAEWTLLWAIGKVEVLGLPTCKCDLRQMFEDIVPRFGSDITGFLATANLRSPGELLAEDDRTYNLWCYANGARRRGEALPDDLDLSVLYERRYAFEWLDGMEAWDDVTCDT